MLTRWQVIFFSKTVIININIININTGWNSPKGSGPNPSGDPGTALFQRVRLPLFWIWWARPRRCRHTSCLSCLSAIRAAPTQLRRWPCAQEENEAELGLTLIVSLPHVLSTYTISICLVAYKCLHGTVSYLLIIRKSCKVTVVNAILQKKKLKLGEVTSHPGRWVMWLRLLSLPSGSSLHDTEHRGPWSVCDRTDLPEN